MLTEPASFDREDYNGLVGLSAECRTGVGPNGVKLVRTEAMQTLQTEKAKDGVETVACWPVLRPHFKPDSLLIKSCTVHNFVARTGHWRKHLVPAPSSVFMGDRMAVYRKRVARADNLHCAHDYVVESPSGPRGELPHRCRVVANPLGYASKGEQEDYRPELVIEV